MKFLHPMFSVLFLLLTVPSCICLDGPPRSLMDLPLTVPAGNFLIHSIITDQNTGDKYFIREYIKSKGSPVTSVEGKIMITKDSETTNVYYSLIDRDLKDSNHRLVIQGMNQRIYSYKNQWSDYLPGVKGRLLNILLLMGPSILYRLDHGSLAWIPAGSDLVRGTNMRSAYYLMNNRLKITYYYKDYMDSTTGLQHPSRFKFSGYDPSASITTSKESLIMDIYMQQRVNDNEGNFDDWVLPETGIGYPSYFLDFERIPALRAQVIHMLMEENLSGATTTRSTSEVHVSGKSNLLRLKTSLLGIETEVLYDYNLGVSFMFQDQGGCSVLSADQRSPGIEKTSRQFRLEELFHLNGDFSYLGKRSYEHRPGYTVKVWESVRKDRYIDTGKYDVAVVTHFFIESKSTKNVFDGHVLIGTTINGYNYDSTKTNLRLVQSLVRDYFDMQDTESESEFHGKFSIENCKDEGKKEMVLAFRYGCTKNECLQVAKADLFEIKSKFQTLILDNSIVSPVRVKTIEVSFAETFFTITVTFLEAPNLRDAYLGKTMLLGSDTLSKLESYVVQSVQECLQRVTYHSDKDVVIFSPDPVFCGFADSLDALKEDETSGKPYLVYNFPLHNSARVDREPLLSDLQNQLMKQTVYRTLTLSRDSGSYIFKLIDILDETPSPADHSKDFYRIHVQGYKLDKSRINVFEVVEAKNFGECYRSCANSQNLDCLTFSYCEGSPNECYITNESGENLKTDQETEKAGCIIYSKAAYLEFTRIPKRRFKTPSSVSVVQWPEQCADTCFTSKNCSSFQSCGSVCTLSGPFTDASTEFDPQCDIFIPNVGHRYAETGREVVADTSHTEISLTLEQCAALCYSMLDPNETFTCRSFNFCPRGRSESSCSISAHSVHDSNTRTIASSSCYNYELVNPKESLPLKQSTAGQSRGTSARAAFGIIVLFLTAGLLIGLVVPFIYSNVSRKAFPNQRMSLINQSFSWNRQTDESENS